MKISKKSLWYNLFMFPTEGLSMNTEDNGKTLCSFFWRTILNVFVWVGMGAGVGILLGMVGAAWVSHPIHGVAVVIILALVVARIWYKTTHIQEETEVPPGVLKSMYKAVKGKFCPRIDFYE